jgi:hypothetical protein
MNEFRSNAVVVRGPWADQANQSTPTVVFLRVQDAFRNNIHGNNFDHGGYRNVNNDDNNFIELLLRERDGFLSCQEIETIKATVSAQPWGTILHCQCFPEKLSPLEGPSFFLVPQRLQQQKSSSSSVLGNLNTNTKNLTASSSSSSSSSVICLHVVAVNVTSSEGEFLPVCPMEKKQISTFKRLLAPRMPALLDPPQNKQPQQQEQRCTNNRRGGWRNRGRDAICAAWALEKRLLLFRKSSRCGMVLASWTLQVVPGNWLLSLECEEESIRPSLILGHCDCLRVNKGRLPIIERRGYDCYNRQDQIVCRYPPLTMGIIFVRLFPATMMVLLRNPNPPRTTNLYRA